MKKVFKILLWAVVILVFLGTFVFLFKNSQPKEEIYNHVKPAIGTIERSSTLTGKIEPRDEIEVKPQISGIISEIKVEAGDFVHEGDVIARIKIIPEASQLSSAQNRVNTASIELADAKAKYERDKSLYDQKVISREDYETSEKTFRTAQENMIAAKDNLTIVKEGVSQYNAKESNTMVRATITGLVLDVPVKVGSSVIQANTMNDGSTVATIADMNNLIFKGNVDETEVGMLRVGMPMKITIGAMPDMHPTATIEYISPKGSSTNGANTFEIKAALEMDSSEGLRAGYSANAAVILQRSENVVTLPESVVEYENGKTYVYVCTDSVKHKYDRREVTVGLSDGISVEVKEGVDSMAVIRSDKVK